MFTLIGSLNLIFKEHCTSLSAELKSYRVDFVLSRAILKIFHRRLPSSPEKRRLKRRRSREEVNYTQEFSFVKSFFSRAPFFLAPLTEKPNPLRLESRRGLAESSIRSNRPTRLARVERFSGRSIDQPTQTRALRNMRIQPETSVQASGCHESSNARWLRSGCGIMIVKRPSVVVTEVRPPAEPFGFIG